MGIAAESCELVCEAEIGAAGGAYAVVAGVEDEGVCEGGFEGRACCCADGEGGGGEETGDVS